MPKYRVRRHGSYHAYVDIDIEAGNGDEAAMAAYEIEATDLAWVTSDFYPEFDGEEVSELPDA